MYLQGSHEHSNILPPSNEQDTYFEWVSTLAYDRRKGIEISLQILDVRPLMWFLRAQSSLVGSVRLLVHPFHW